MLCTVGHRNKHRALHVGHHGVCLPSAGAVESPPSSVGVSSAEVRGYILGLAGKKHNSGHSTKFTGDGLHQAGTGEHTLKKAGA